MMKQSNLLKWNRNNPKNGNKNWIHPPEALQQGHIVYLVKFLGSIEVDKAKGIDVVKDGIRKLKFSQHLKKAEGAKTPKVEVTISIDGVAIQDQKTKQIFHQYPLHRISYCANDKSDKKFFSFIAKEENIDKHMCFVFASEKLAEDITLTIGEAFDLAYRKFLNTSGKDLETKKQLMILQRKVQELEKENAHLKQQLAEITKGEFSNKHMIKNKIQVNGDSNGFSPPNEVNSNIEISPTPPSKELFNLITLPAVGTKLENLSMDDMEDFNPREDTTHKKDTDVFGAPPFNPTQQGETDPFGMGDFSNLELENAIGEIDKKISEMRDGFQRGLSFGKEDFFGAE